MSLNDIEVKVDRSDLLCWHRLLDTVVSELAAYTDPGDVKEDVFIEAEAALIEMEKYLK